VTCHTCLGELLQTGVTLLFPQEPQNEEGNAHLPFLSQGNAVEEWILEHFTS
jgi:hypothetical protein